MRRRTHASKPPPRHPRRDTISRLPWTLPTPCCTAHTHQLVDNNPADHLGLLFYAVAPGPIEAEIVFYGAVLPAPKPFGGDLAATVPLVTTLPEASDAVLTKFSTTLGPEHITYWEYDRGRYIPYHPRGICYPSNAHEVVSSSPPRLGSRTDSIPTLTRLCRALAPVCDVTADQTAANAPQARGDEPQGL